MTAWSNIEISSGDSEILNIDKLEKTLKPIPSNVRQIRELITRFEVCHFKYQRHYRYIKESIFNLKPGTDPKQIGTTHIRNADHAWKKDKTGRSLKGQRYVWALNKWLDDNSGFGPSDDYSQELNQQITKWLGKKTPEKERLIRLLISRLKWDWKSYKELQHGGKYEVLEWQACRMDICHYAFPMNLDLLLQGIGKMKPVEVFEGCGSFDSKIKAFVEKEFTILNDMLKSITAGNKKDKNQSLKTWLIACMAKTMKEQVGLTQPIDEIIN